nr:aspartate 1-decarboxylase [Thermoleophilaceae bacterium]
GEVCINGAAARLVHKGDKVIVVSYASYSEEELEDYAPRVVLVDEYNRRSGPAGSRSTTSERGAGSLAEVIAR